MKKNCVAKNNKSKSKGENIATNISSDINKKSEVNSIHHPKNNKLYFGYSTRVIIFLLLLIISLATCLYFASKTIEREKLSPIRYNEKGEIDYKVYLNKNEFYDEEYLEMNKAYIASLIKYIDVNFNYSFDIATITNMDFDYRILGELVIENNGGTKRYFEKTYTLLESKKKKLVNDNQTSIKENLKIDYNYYNQLANSFRNTYGVDTNSYLKVYLEVKSKTADNLNYNIDNVDNVLLKIPLSERAIEINFDANNRTVTKYVVPSGKIIFNSKYLIIEIVLFLITTFFFVKFIKYISVTFKNTTKYDKYVNKILKEYDRLIVETHTDVDLSKYNIVEVKKFTELLDVRDNLKVPILYYCIAKHEKGMFYIKDNDTVYLLTIKNVDLETKKNK